MKFDEEKRQKAIQKAKTLAEEFDPKEAKEFINKHKNAKWYQDFMLLYEMITDKDFKISKQVYLAIAGALAYVILPVDVIPDFIPGVGFIDDVFVIGFVMQSIADEIARFKKYKKAKESGDV